MNKFIRNKKILVIFPIVIVLLVLSIFIIKDKMIPKLKLVTTTSVISYDSNEEIRVQAVLTDLPDNIYPAANVSIEFDKDKLELVDFTIGTMKVYDDYDEASDDEPKFKIPQWTYNLDMANEQGIINAMYLDTTVGKNAYIKDGFKKGKNDIPFQLIFKLKKSVIADEKLEIKINEAMFATVTGSEDKSTLSTKDNYGKLNTENLIIKTK